MSRAGAGAFCCVYLAVQILLALRGPLNPGEQVRLTWRMFLRPQRPVSFQVGFADGRITDLEKLEPRPEVNFVGQQVNRVRFVPPHLCRQIPAASWIRATRPGGESREHRCR